MTRKTLHTLIAIIIGLLLLLLVIRSNDLDDATVGARLLLPEIKAVANAVNAVRVKRPAADEGVTLKLDDSKWVVSERDGYPADVGKLRQLIVALADARILEEKTSNPAHYDKLGVGDPEDGGNGTKVIITAHGAAYEVILGHTAQGEYRYARVTGDATSYLVDQNPDLPQTTGDWLLPDVVDIRSERIKRVTITHADGETIVIEKADREQTDFNVAGIPEGRELSYATVGNGIAGALAALELQDVRSAVGAATTTTVYETWDGLRVTAEIVSDDDKNWVAFAVESDTESSDAADEATEIEARVSGWQYRLPEHKKNLLIRRWDDILKATDTD
jgi:hypothetical protein